MTHIEMHGHPTGPDVQLVRALEGCNRAGHHGDKNPRERET